MALPGNLWTDNGGQTRLYDEWFHMPIILSESESNLRGGSAPRFWGSRLDIEGVLLSRIVGRSDNDMKDTPSVIIDGDSTHCPTALAIRT